MSQDNASEKIIEQTDSLYKNYVRLYFRPKTPTKYHNEGFKTEEQLAISQLNAQCSIPVFLFLDIRKLLAHPYSSFTDRSLALSAPHKIYSTPEEFNKLPFDKIYHDGALNEAEKREIIGHRQAEIIFPESLPIEDYLKKIIVRTPAEKETLLTLMSDELKRKYEDYIQIDSSKNIFFSRWTYFNNVQLAENYIQFNLNISQYQTPSIPTQFDLKISFKQSDLEWKSQVYKNWLAVQKLKLNFKDSIDNYEVAFHFSDQLMYYGRYQSEANSPY